MVGPLRHRELPLGRRTATTIPTQIGDDGRPEPVDLPLFAAGAGEESPRRVAGGGPVRALIPEPPTSSVPGSGVGAGVVGWEVVAQLRAEASGRLTARLEREGSRLTDVEREQVGLAVIAELVRAESEERVSSGRPAWSPEQEEHLRQALFDAIFGLGRLQPLVDDESLENIIITARGASVIVCSRTSDGTLSEGPPVADSEDDLREFLADLGARQNRPFTEARPSLHLRLPGGARLAAASWVTAHTSVVIRRHRLVEVSMEEMVDQRGACSPSWRTSCPRVSGPARASWSRGSRGRARRPGVRALCSQIPSHEMIGTFETEFELHLHEMTGRHRIVHAWEHRPGSGEVGVAGRQAGEFTLEEAIHDSFRFNLDRQIVGEVRGPRCGRC